MRGAAGSALNARPGSGVHASKGGANYALTAHALPALFFRSSPACNVANCARCDSFSARFCDTCSTNYTLQQRDRTCEPSEREHGRMRWARQQRLICRAGHATPARQGEWRERFVAGRGGADYPSPRAPILSFSVDSPPACTAAHCGGCEKGSATACRFCSPDYTLRDDKTCSLSEREHSAMRGAGGSALSARPGRVGMAR